MNGHHEPASTELISNKGFEEWGEAFGDEVAAPALADRILHDCHLVNILGNSYRMREQIDLCRRVERREFRAGRKSASQFKDRKRDQRQREIKSGQRRGIAYTSIRMFL